MKIKFNDVSLINNYKQLFEKDYLIHANVEFLEGNTYLIKGENSKYFIGKLIMGFIEPTFGSIDIGNYQLKRNRYQKHILDLRRNIAYLPFDYESKFNYKQVNNIFKEALYNYNYMVQKDNELVENIINKTGCYLDYKSEILNNLNSIQRYKLYLASLLIYNPQIIILEKVINDDKIISFLNHLAHDEDKIVIFIGNYKMPVDKTYVINKSQIAEV